MMARNMKTLILSVALLSLGCSSNSSSSTPSSLVVTDTQGKEFTASCSSSLCALTPKDATLRPYSCSVASGTDTFVILWSRILMVHVMNVVSGSAVEFSAAEPTRPVACTVDADCSPWNQQLNGVNYEYTCVNAICQAASLSLSTNDVIALCQADIPWPSGCPYITSSPFASRMAEVGVACGLAQKCAAVPADCKQPTAAVDAGAPGPTGIDSGATTPASTAELDAGF
jgi:hypothetical protein